MNDEVKKIIGESYKRLPFDLKKAIVSSETRQRMQMIAEKHRLYSDQAADLELETALVMLGLRPPSDFITNVKNALEIPEEKARAIAEDINVEIFRPIRESLKKIHGINEPPLPIRVDSNRGSSILQDKIGTLPTPTPIPPPSPIPPAPVIPKLPAPPAPPPLPKPEDETKLNREEILAGIENPAPTKPTSGNIVQDKLSGIVRMPKSVEEVKELPPPLSKPSYATDPYREHI